MEKTINKIKIDFSEKLLSTAVHEISHAIYAVIYGYSVTRIILEEQKINDNVIDGKAQIDLSPDYGTIQDLCSSSFTGSFGDKEKYKELGKFYIELLLIGYVAESEFLDLKMDFVSPVPQNGFTISFDNQVDGVKCGLILANNHNYNIGMRRVKQYYYANVREMVQSSNYRIVLEKLLQKAFYYDLKFFKIKKKIPKIRKVKIISKLVKQYNIQN